MVQYVYTRLHCVSVFRSAACLPGSFLLFRLHSSVHAGLAFSLWRRQVNDAYTNQGYLRDICNRQDLHWVQNQLIGACIVLFTIFWFEIGLGSASWPHWPPWMKLSAGFAAQGLHLMHIFIYMFTMTTALCLRFSSYSIGLMSLPFPSHTLGISNRHLFVCVLSKEEYMPSGSSILATVIVEAASVEAQVSFAVIIIVENFGHLCYLL